MSGRPNLPWTHPEVILVILCSAKYQPCVGGVENDGHRRHDGMQLLLKRCRLYVWGSFIMAREVRSDKEEVGGKWE